MPDRLKGETELLKKKQEWAEKKRLEMIEEAKKERRKIIHEQDLKQAEKKRISIIDANDKLDRSVVAHEREQLQGIQKRQEKELSSLVESEMNIEKLKAQTEALVLKQKERERIL